MSNEQEQVEKPVVEDKSTEIDYAKELKALKESQEAYDQRFKEMDDLIKKRDSTISRIANEKKELELSKLSDAERLKAEREEALKENEAIKAETARLHRQRELDHILYDSGLPVDLFGDRVKGETAEDMKADVAGIKTYIDELVQQGIETEIKTRLGGKSPQGGKPVVNNLESQIAEAMKAGNIALVSKLKREALAQE